MNDDGYNGYESANGDIGRVMDDIQDIDGVVTVELDDTRHRTASGGRIPWSEITLSLSIKPETTDE
jgi:hypothetical protein